VTTKIINQTVTTGKYRSKNSKYIFIFLTLDVKLIPDPHWSPVNSLGSSSPLLSVLSSYSSSLHSCTNDTNESKLLLSLLNRIKKKKSEGRRKWRLRRWFLERWLTKASLLYRRLTEIQ
jgi:hypothetical protein